MPTNFLSGKTAVRSLIVGGGAALLGLTGISIPAIYTLPVLSLTVGGFISTYLLLYLGDKATEKMS